MATFLFGWNPNQENPASLQSAIDDLLANGSSLVPWRSGNRRDLPTGSRAFLIRLGSEPRGIIGAGWTRSEPVGSPPGVKIEFESLSETPRIPFMRLQQPPFSRYRWSIQASGVKLPKDIASELEEAWLTETEARQSLRAENKNLSPSCIYTIRHSRQLAAEYDAGGKGEFTEHARWTTGSQLLQEARQSQWRVPVLFAPAELIDGIIYWALIDDIALAAHGTTVKFSALQRLSKKWPLHSLTKLSTGERLSDSYIRPYVLCKTPSFLQKLAVDSPSPLTVPDIEVDEISAREGAVSTRQHLHRERDRTIIAAKRQQVLAATGRLACAVCGFDFQEFYGDVGAEFCEVHHLLSLAAADGEVETRLADLATVCSNCHRMLHRSHPFLTLEQLASKIRKAQPVCRLCGERVR